MIERFRQLARREQIVLLVGTSLAVLIIGWRFVWEPLFNGSAELSESVAENARLVVDLQRAANLSSGSGTAAPTRGGSLVVLMEQTAVPIGLLNALTARRPDGNDAINVTLRDAPFDILVSWLTGLERDHGLTVVNASATPSDEPGFIDGQVRLER